MGELIGNLLGQKKPPVPTGPGMAGPPMTTPPINGGAGMPIPTSPATDDGDPIAVQGDGWKPKQPTLLGILADGYLMSQGMKPAFANNRDARNVQEALSGYGSDPESTRAAIKRLNRIRGQQGEALKLYENLTDNERADRQVTRSERLLDIKEREYFMDRVAGMFGAATPENFKQIADLAKKYVKYHGVELPFEIPSEYDENFITGIRLGEVPVAKQMKLDQDQWYRGERLEDADQAESGRNTRFYTGEGNKDRRLDIVEDGKDRRKTMPKPIREPRYVKTPRGNMELSPSGNLGRIVKDGKVQTWKKTSPGKWEMMKEELDASK